VRPGLLLLAFALFLSSGCITSVAQSSTDLPPEPYTGPSIADIVAANATPVPTRIPAKPMNTTLEPAPVATPDAPATDLRALALRVEDVPAGFQLVRELTPPNADVANLTSDPDKVFDLLESTGRLMGFTNIFAKMSVDGTGTLPVVTIALNRYRDPARMSDAWSAYEDVTLKYPAVPFVEPTSIDAPKLGDQSAAKRMSMTDASGQKLVLFWTYFRQGTTLAGVTTVASEAQADNGDLSAKLATKLFERVSARPQGTLR
jgi:hypothetical protein